jgi:hypothetical protein
VDVVELDVFLHKSKSLRVDVNGVNRCGRHLLGDKYAKAAYSREHVHHHFVGLN